MAGVDLASELPFKIGRFEVRPSTRELVVGDERMTVEPRVLQVLVVLARRIGAVVSRDELIATCWAGRTVGQEALNRCIAVLRRPGAGAFEPGFAIETIPRVGYRLADAAPVPDASPAGRAAPDRRRLALIGIGGAAALAAGSIWALTGPPEAWVLQGVQPLVSTPVAERQPAVSPDGRLVAYTVGDDARHRDVFVRPIDGGTARRLTDETGDKSAPSWSPDGRRIVYTLFREGQPCTFVVRDYPAGTARPVARCTAGLRGTAVFGADGRSLIVAGTGLTERPQGIVGLDLASRRRVPLTTPAGTSMGDTEPAVAPTGDRLAFLRSLTDQSAQIVVRDLATGREMVAVQSDLRADHFAWAPDGRALLFDRRDDATSSLWGAPLDGTPPRRIATLGVRAERIAMAPGGGIVADVNLSRYDVAWAPAGSDARGEFVDPMNGRTYSPVFAPDGTLATASDRSGRWAIWLTPPGQPARAIANHAIGETLRWSPDGSRLAFATSDGGHLVLRIVDRHGREGPATPLPLSGAATVTWGEGGRELVFAGQDRAGWRIFAVRPGAPASCRPLSAYGFWDVETRGSEIYGLRADKTGIWRLDAQPHPIWHEQPATELASWRVIGDDLVWIDFAIPARRRLLAQPLSGGPSRVIADTPDMADFGQFDLDPRSHRYVYVRAASQDHDLFLLRFARNGGL